MPFLPSFCIAFSLSSFDEPPMVAGARAAAACGLQSHGAVSALLPNAVAVPRRLAPALVAAKRPGEALRLGEHAATSVELCWAAGRSANEYEPPRNVPTTVARAGACKNYARWD